VLIAVTPKGAVWVDGQPVDLHRVGQQVAGMLSGEGSVVIQADRESTTGVLIEVMDRLQQAGVEQVAVAASRSAP
jgi:biopolymer transport protein ExbD